MTGTQPAAEVAAHHRLVASTAANLAGWHDVNLRALGLRTAWRDGWWLTPDDAPGIYFRAIAVRPGADPAVPARECHPAGWLAACDPWSDLPLDAHGLAFEADRPWMRRSAGPVKSIGAAQVAGSGGFRVERVTDAPGLLAFERTAATGFGSSVPSPHTWHAPGLLTDGRTDLWLGHAGTDVVSTANGFREAAVLGIYSVATVPGARRRGHGRAITAHAIAASPDLPAVLQPSEMAEPLYRSLGFERFTTFRTWTRTPR